MEPTLRSDRNPTYRSYKAMKRRCNDLNNDNYGGRGITYSPEWEDFDVFLSDMGTRPPDSSLERLDSDDHYYKENCRWASYEAQANNRCSSRYLTYQGVTLSVTQWSRMIGISDQTLFHRLRAGWTVEEALTAPLKQKFKGNQWSPK